MEKINKSLWAILLFMVLVLSGCDKKWPMNGNLDGYWQMLSIENKQTGEITECKSKRMYMGIQLRMVELKDLGENGYLNMIGEFSYDEDQNLAVFQNLKEKVSTGDNNTPVTVSESQKYGIENPEKTIFKVIKANGKDLILESENYILIMRLF